MKNVLAFVFALLMCGVASASSPWCEQLWLGEGGVWTSRVETVFSNDSSVSWTGRTVSVKSSSLGVEGVPIRELRLTDSRGRLFSFGVSSGTGRTWYRTGNVPRGSLVVFPLDVPANSTAAYYLYHGNPSAWEYSEYWNHRADGEMRPAIKKETLSFKRVGHEASWASEFSGNDGSFRVPVTVMNLSDEPRNDVLAMFRFADAVHALSDPEYALTLCGRKQLCARYGRQLIFPVSLAPKTVYTYYLYVRVRNGMKKSLQEKVSSALGGELLAQQSVTEPVVFGEKERSSLQKILSGRVNLLKNPLFENSAGRPEGWRVGEGRAQKGVSLHVSEAGGAIGARCAVTSVDHSVPSAWRGYGQKVSVKPSLPYFMGVFVKAENGLKGEMRLGYKVLDSDGKAVAGDRTRRAVRSDVPWTDLWMLADMPEGAACIEFNPWGRYNGILSLDAAVVAQYSPTEVGPREYPQSAKTPEFVARSVSPSAKVFPDETIKDSKEPYGISLARNESEDLQLAVRSGRGFSNLAVEVDAPKNASGEVLDVKVHLVGLVPVDAPSGGNVYPPKWTLHYPKYGAPSSDGWHGWWPDPLIRTNACVLAEEWTRAFRVSVKAGSSARAGMYKGAVRWLADGRPVRAVPFDVKVWNFSIPERPQFSATFDIRFERSYWRMPEERDFKAARRRLVDLMAEYKVCPEQFEYGTIFSRNADGEIVADFSEHDKGAEEFFEKYRFPCAYFPRTPFYVFGYAMKTHDFLGEPAYEPGEKDPARLRPKYVKDYQTALRMYWDHIKAKGWADKMVLYVSDEPTYWDKSVVKRLTATCRMIHEVDPKIPIYSSTWSHKAEWNDSIDVWGAGAYGCFPLSEMEALRKRGKRLWFTTDGQLCMTTPYSAVEQLMAVYSYVYGAERYEYWGVNWVTIQPWRYGWHSYSTEGRFRGVSGSGFIAYPPMPGSGDPRPCASVRMAAVRDGVELRSYLDLLDGLAKGKGASAEAARAILGRYRELACIPNAGGRFSTRLFPDGPERFDELRQSAGELLDSAPYDLVIYGSTPAAISAAVQAKRMGKRAVVVSPEKRIGGMTTGGLGRTDVGDMSAFGGIAIEFYSDVAKHYSNRANWVSQKPEDYSVALHCFGRRRAGTMWSFEPSAALKILEGWEKRDGLDIHRGEWLDRKNGVIMREGAISAIRTLSGNTYSGKVFVDATYEGDLMAAAGVSYAVGRESNCVYGETINGNAPNARGAGNHNFHEGVSAYVKEGDRSSGLLPGIEPYNPYEKPGDGDRRVQAYCFRMCLTDVPENRIPFKRPASYNEQDYELLFREYSAVEANPQVKVRGCLDGKNKIPFIMSSMPNRKTDSNNRTGFSSDFIGRNWAWPEGSYEVRENIFREHLEYQKGLMWTLANHPRIPKSVRDYFSKWGTCRDEFRDGPGDGWPGQLYVREARRMIGESVMTEHHCRGSVVADRPVAMGVYTMDSHHVRRVETADGFVRNEGNVEDSRSADPNVRMRPYGIDYGAIVPKKEECKNLIVPVCLSASHIAFGSIRMEPVFFALGQVAGTAASQAVDVGCSVQEVPYRELSARLVADGQVISLHKY